MKLLLLPLALLAVAVPTSSHAVSASSPKTTCTNVGHVTGVKHPLVANREICILRPLGAPTADADVHVLATLCLRSPQITVPAIKRPVHSTQIACVLPIKP